MVGFEKITLTKQLFMTISETLKQGCKCLEIPLADDAVEKLDRYVQELIKWNSKMNLVAKANERDIIENHFLDSLTLLPLIISHPVLSLLDVGTGAGFPGLVLKAACPDLDLTLIEPRAKRVTFLRHIARLFAYDQLTIINDRLRLEPDSARRYSCITSRAVSSITDFLSLVHRHCMPGGTVICMKGPKAGEEIRQWQHDTPDSPFTLAEEIKWTLPFSKATRNILIFTHNET